MELEKRWIRTVAFDDRFVEFRKAIDRLVWGHLVVNRNAAASVVFRVDSI